MRDGTAGKSDGHGRREFATQRQGGLEHQPKSYMHGNRESPWLVINALDRRVRTKSGNLSGTDTEELDKGQKSTLRE